MKTIGLTEGQYEHCLNDLRLCQAGLTDDTWEDIVKKYNIPYHADTLRKATQTVFGGAFVGEYYRCRNKLPADSEFNEALLELKKERVKVQTEKLELNKVIREIARHEMICEKIANAIKELPLLERPRPIPSHGNDRAGVLLFSDEHYGAAFTIKGLQNEVVSEYSPDIFKQTMENLLGQLKDIVVKEHFSKISIFELGDCIDGILRTGQLFQLKCGVIESTMQYAEYLAQWLTEVSKFVKIEFQMTFGNHSELRLLGEPKGTFPEENMGYVVKAYLKIRLAGNQNIEMVNNDAGLVYANLVGYNLLGIHGEIRDMESALKNFSLFYHTKIDFLVAGHYHHAKAESVSDIAEVINIPSIVGTNCFSAGLLKRSRAGATFLIIERGLGNVMQYNIKL